MPTCSQGHDSADEEYCDVCGLALDQTAPVGTVVAQPEGAKSCPSCGAPLDDRFCEGCGADSWASPAPVVPAPVAAVEVAPVAVAPVAVARPKTWSVVVTADKRYYESVKAEGGPDADSIMFPPYCPERHFSLQGEQISIGRRSATRGILPDIDLTGPPEDPGVSRLHAMLVAQPDGWAIVDINSANGTFLNYRRDNLRPNTPRPLADGDRIHLGAWTTITIQAD